MNHANVKSRMKSAIMNVKLELNNFKHLTGVDIPDDRKKEVDLPEL